MMKPLKDEEGSRWNLRKQSQSAVYRFRTTLASGEGWWRQMQARRVLQQMSDERLGILGYAGRMCSDRGC